ncbi:MAG: MarR family transcriptional regulator [Burkholderiaceae bacterium]
MGERFLRTVRLLAQCYQSFERISGAHLRRRTDLTPAQFDIIATLGNTAGMTFKELGDKTLITKGTLTGVIDRLERRGLVRREPLAADRRSVRIVLSDAGQREFERVFGLHIAYLKQAFAGLGDADFDGLEQRLGGLLEQLETFRAQLAAEGERPAAAAADQPYL